MSETVTISRGDLLRLLREAWLDGKGCSTAPMSTTKVKAEKAAGKIIDRNFPALRSMAEG